MKQILSLFFLPVFFTFLPYSQYLGPDPVDKLASKVAKEVSKKYGLSPCSIGGAVKEGKPWRVTVDFRFEGNALSIDEGRNLIVHLAEDFMKTFNQQVDPQLLYEYPFTAKNINLGIYCTNKKGLFFMDPFVHTLVASNNEIGLFTQDSQDAYKYKQKIYEPYEEAVEKVK